MPTVDKYASISQQINSSLGFLDEQTFYPIGESIHIGQNFVIDKLVASASGQLVIIDRSLTHPGVDPDRSCSNLAGVSAILRQWRHDNLDAAIEDHLYEVTGQAANAGEVMVRHGAFNYSGVRAFDGGVNVSLYQGVPVLLFTNEIHRSDAAEIREYLSAVHNIQVVIV